MKLLIYKTNIKTKKAAKNLVPLFNELPVEDWCVDMHDIDRVLRIEADEKLSENEMISKLSRHGVKCEELSD
ncbi:MAG: hypothetical protein RLO17_10395 [Cyclobacteriaceae bacterium]